MSPEVFRTGYHTLLEVQLLHRYFLNVGTTKFEDAPTSPSVMAAWRAYDLRQFCRLEPSPATRALLAEQRLLLRPLAEGFRVAQALDAAGTAPAVPLDASTELTFWLYLTDPAWPLYTDPGAGYEFARLVPSPTNPAGQVLVLSYDEQDDGSASTAPFVSLKQSLEPWPAAASPDRPLAVLRLRLLSSPGTLPDPRHFRHVFDNRRTTWEYKGSPVRPNPLPLVHHGRVVPDGAHATLPNPSPATTEQRPDGIYYSVIY
ncbi:MAG TPA: hypothetical protein VFO93_07190 [Hymenobacter sp.]|uniref:hypothetical protein n=1 Tax=Hymenobacter sp. TaxID=1898978 RepID=UPI002D80DBCA|nr:hypothetical protein [Hymenobacter sp.]HET9503307.1 hypothetical protein [Hymenobacter sp.]